jgi:hypothetical protein
VYLDPGSAGLFVQAIFATIATVIAVFGRSRAWIAFAWQRITDGISRYLRRSDS